MSLRLPRKSKDRKMNKLINWSENSNFRKSRKCFRQRRKLRKDQLMFPDSLQGSYKMQLIGVMKILGLKAAVMEFTQILTMMKSQLL